MTEWPQQQQQQEQQQQQQQASETNEWEAGKKRADVPEATQPEPDEDE